MLAVSEAAENKEHVTYPCEDREIFMHAYCFMCMEDLIAKMTFIADIAFVGVMTWASPFIALPTGQMSPDFGSSRYTVQLIRYDPGQATLASCA